MQSVHLPPASGTVPLKGDRGIGDRQVGSGDIQAVAARWRLTAADPDPDGDPATPNYSAAFDRDGDGSISVADIMGVAAGWGDCPICVNLSGCLEKRPSADIIMDQTRDR